MVTDKNLDLLKDISPDDYWYAASVYTQDPLGMENAYENSLIYHNFLISHGIQAFVPIAHCHPTSVRMPQELNTHENWMKQDRPMVKHAIGILVAKMPGWEKSKGIKMEIDWAREQGKPVYYLEWEFIKHG